CHASNNPGVFYDQNNALGCGGSNCSSIFNGAYLQQTGAGYQEPKIGYGYQTVQAQANVGGGAACDAQSGVFFSVTTSHSFPHGECLIPSMWQAFIEVPGPYFRIEQYGADIDFAVNNGPEANYFERGWEIIHNLH